MSMLFEIFIGLCFAGLFNVIVLCLSVYDIIKSNKSSNKGDYMNFGFIKTGACVPEMRVADIDFNVTKIKENIDACEQMKVRVTVFPELCITGYTCADLFQQDILIDGALNALINLKKYTAGKNGVYIIGVPLHIGNSMFNCGAVLYNGRILGIVPKTYITNYKEFCEKRWFKSSFDLHDETLCVDGEDVPVETKLLFQDISVRGLCFGVEINEDLWSPVPPSSYHAMAGARLIFNLSADNEVVGKKDYRLALIKQQSGKCICGYIYSSCGTNESSTDLLFSGHAVISEYGSVLAESERFIFNSQLIVSEIDLDKITNMRLVHNSFDEGYSPDGYRIITYEGSIPEKTELTRHISRNPFVPDNVKERDERCREILEIQTSSLAKRIKHTGLKKAVIGVSGGLDSTLALLVVVRTMDKLDLPRENISAITMPGFGTTDRTYLNAVSLIKSLGATFREINITEACLQHFKDIGHDPAIHDTTYENVQARERTQILMDIANREGGLVIGTGDLSEMALGWCTYNGDHMSMYSVNASIPKTLVKYLVKWMGDNSQPEVKAILNDILDTPISPELLPKDADGKISQKTEDIVGPYELHDFFLYHMIRYGATPEKIFYIAKYAFKNIYDDETIKKWLKLFIRRFFTQQFKRSCTPDGPKVGTVSLSPRGDWKMPSDAVSNVWLKELG